MTQQHAGQPFAVGESGPELIYIPPGTSVFSQDEILRRLQSMTQQQQPQRPDELTPAEIKAIIAEINEWHAPGEEGWKVWSISQFYKMPMEAYEVTYEDSFSHVWTREEDGKLRPAYKLTYFAPTFERPKKEG